MLYQKVAYMAFVPIDLLFLMINYNHGFIERSGIWFTKNQ